MMNVRRGSCAVQMDVVKCAKLECLLEFVSLRGKSTVLVKASQLEMDAIHGKLLKCYLLILLCVNLCACMLNLISLQIQHMHCK